MKTFGLFSGLTLSLMFVSASLAQPANDFFADRETLVGTNLSFIIDNTGATLESGETSPVPGSTGATLWYSWTAPFTGRVTLNSYSTPISGALAVYTGSSLGQLELIKSSAGTLQGYLVFWAEVGTVYQLQIDSMSGSSGEFPILLTAEQPQLATNDNFNDAIFIPQLGSTKFTSIGEATLEPGEPAHLGGVPCKSLWWRCQPLVSGTLGFNSSVSLATNLILMLYSGPSLDHLTLQAMATNRLIFNSARGGKLYSIAVLAAPEAVGDVRLACSFPPASPDYAPRIPVPGNLLCEPSLEGTALEFMTCWQLSSNYYGGFVGERGGADGVTWITLQAGASMWQEFVTVPGRQHEVRFAFRPEWGATSGRVRVLWDQEEIGFGECLLGESIVWHWTNLTAMATGKTSRITFQILEGTLSLDAFSVVPLSAPPDILTQPSSLTTFTNGSASFLVVATGTPPLTYQWFFDQQPIPGGNHSILLMTNLSAFNAGGYFVVVSNTYGTVTSSPVTLVLETPSSPTIVLQPYGDTMAAGGYFAFTVAAVGPPPLKYQWYHDEALVPGATNSRCQFVPVQPADAGTYTVKVWNDTATVWSLPATLKVTTNTTGGGAFLFFNAEIPDGGVVRYEPVTDADGLTLLSGANFLAQLYAGPSLAEIRPVGQPRPFLTGINEGLIDPETVVLPTVPVGTEAFLQVRVWEAAKGGTFESARALGGRFGRSAIFRNQPGLPSNPPPLWLMRSLSLQAGLPHFTTGKIRLIERQPGGVIIWGHEGQPGFRYVIEKSFHGLEWHPYLVVTNVTSIVTFKDSANSGSAVVLYRSRILD